MTTSCDSANLLVVTVLNGLGGTMCGGSGGDPMNPVCMALAKALASHGDVSMAAKEISKISKADLVTYFKTQPNGAKALTTLSPVADALGCIFTGAQNHFTNAERQALVRFKEWLLMDLQKAVPNAPQMSTKDKWRMKVGTDLMLGESKDALLFCGGVVIVTILITALLAHKAWKKRSF